MNRRPLHLKQLGEGALRRLQSWLRTSPRNQRECHRKQHEQGRGPSQCCLPQGVLSENQGAHPMLGWVCCALQRRGVTDIQGDLEIVRQACKRTNPLDHALVFERSIWPRNWAGFRLPEAGDHQRRVGAKPPARRSGLRRSRRRRGWSLRSLRCSSRPSAIDTDKIGCVSFNQTRHPGRQDPHGGDEFGHGVTPS